MILISHDYSKTFIWDNCTLVFISYENFFYYILFSWVGKHFNFVSLLLKMLAKEVLEDGLLSLLTDDVPDIEVDGDASSGKVVHASIRV